MSFSKKIGNIFKKDIKQNEEFFRHSIIVTIFVLKTTVIRTKFSTKLIVNLYVFYNFNQNKDNAIEGHLAEKYRK